MSGRRLTRYAAELRDRYGANERLLLVQLPQVVLGAFNRDVALAGSYYIFPPTGLQFLYESIRHRGLDVRILDLNFRILKAVREDPDFDVEEWPAILEAELDDFRPGHVGVSCLFDFAIGPMTRALTLLKERGESVVTVGGVIATYEWRNLLARDLCHFVVEGEGERKFDYLLSRLSGEIDVEPTVGIRFKDADGFHESEGDASPVHPQGDLVASYDLVPVEEYEKYGSLNPYSRMDNRPRAPFAAIQMSRGCRAACTFCSVRDFMGKGVRFRPIADILAEMAFLIEKRGVRHFEWLDDDLLFYRKELRDLLRAVIERGWDIRWSANNGLIAASLDEETLDLIRDSGCIGFKIGIETGNAEMLRKVRKPGNLDKFRRVSSLLERAPGVFVGGNFIVGLPDERFGQMLDSFRFSLEMRLDWSAMTVCQMIRGASAFADAGEYFEDQMRTDGSNVANFIPSRHTANGHMRSRGRLLRGLDVFAFPPDQVPDDEQVKEIWFAFNLLGNYAFNKNLSPGGRPEKFVAWVASVLVAYPTNPYMNLFLSLAHAMLGNKDVAESHRLRARENVKDDYWRGRFESFGLFPLLAEAPETREEAHAALERLRRNIRFRLAKWLDGEEEARLSAAK